MLDAAGTADPGGAALRVCTSEELRAFVALAREAGIVALDTEFMGEGRFRTLLCLVQLASATAEGARVELVDPLADEEGLGELAQLLADPTIEVVVHAGRQDIALLRRALNTDVTNVFDTQLAAGFAGMSAQSSYESLLGAFLGLRVAKSAGFTRWDRRPLSEEQLSYAREDVLHLLELSQRLQERLRSLGRLEWALQECEALALSSDERDEVTIFMRLPRIRSLAPRSLAAARELVAWRERTAERRDRPVQSVLQDIALVEIAKRRPPSLRELGDIRGVGEGLLRRHGPEILRTLESADERDGMQLERRRSGAPPDPADAPLVALCEALVRARAQRQDLAYELLASRAELAEIVVSRRLGLGEPSVRVLEGWRREIAGAALLELLDGRISVSVRESRLVDGM